jgi:PA-IL-like protein
MRPLTFRRALAIATICGAVIAVTAAAATSVISVPAVAPFLNTRVVLAPGEHATISATGRISYGSQNPACAGTAIAPSGCSAEQICPVAGGCGALVGRLGDKAAFLVGDRRTVTGPGELWLGINDQAGAFGDNSGHFTATIATDGGPHVEVAKVLRLSGRLYVRRDTTDRVQALHVGDLIRLHDELLTTPDGRAVLEFIIGGRVTVGPGAHVEVTGERSVNGGTQEDTGLTFPGSGSPPHVEIQTNGGVIGGIKG